MLHFHETGLLSALTALPTMGRVAFAAAAASRQLGNYERFDYDVQSQGRPREIARDLWVAMRCSIVDHALWSARLTEVTALLPENTWNEALGHALAEGALSSLAYAVRCLLNPDPQEAAWAARCAYEAADQAAIRLLGARPGAPKADTAILAHELVQRELSRQQQDLSLLRVGSLDEVERKSLEDELLSGLDARALIALA